MNQIDRKSGLGSIDVGPSKDEIHKRNKMGAAPSGPQEIPHDKANVSASKASPRPSPRKPISKPVNSSEHRVLTNADIAEIRRVLLSEDKRIARQSDLVSLHKSLVESLRILGAGLGDRTAKAAAEDREEISKRIEEMSKSVNEMEGMLRIELGPEMSRQIEAGLDRRAPVPAHRARVRPGWILMICVAFLAGVFLAPELRPTMDLAISEIAERFF